MLNCPCRQVFRFKQFQICQDQAAMKVGTDGVLLGAWTRIENAQTALDVGTGTGLLALMLAQRNAGLQIDAVELDSLAAKQAQFNVQASPWKDRISVFNVDFQQFTAIMGYDIIISNPPFFDEQTISPAKQRQMARHTAHLDIQTLLSKTAALLSPKGRLSIIYPATKYDEILHVATQNNLFINRLTFVKGNTNVKAKRILIELSRQQTNIKENFLIIEHERHVYTDAYVELTKDFYLKM